LNIPKLKKLCTDVYNLFSDNVQALRTIKMGKKFLLAQMFIKMRVFVQNRNS